jgi:microcystin-dependent protein
MAEPFLAEIRIVGFTFAPRGWAQCDGQILPINQYQALYSLLGTTYGGDGRTSFALPDLRSRTPIHKGASPGGSNHTLGQKSGVEDVELTQADTPSHTHAFNVASADATLQRQETPDGGSVLAKANIDMYGPLSGPTQALNGGAMSSVGGGDFHTNIQPTLVLNYIIALQGTFPSRN